jgi:hypothetical protein
MMRHGRGWANFERDLNIVLTAAEEEQRRVSPIRSLWRTFWASFWAGFRNALQARPAPPSEEPQAEEAPTRADAERELREAMDRYGLKDSDRRRQAGKES